MKPLNMRLVEAATVRLPRRGGQGVLVPGGYVLTAAHCIAWNSEGGMALGDHCLEPVEIPKGAKPFKLNVCAVEPVADIAILGAPDSQVFYDDAEAFDSFVENTRPVHVRGGNFELLEGKIHSAPLPIHVLTHTGKWLMGVAKRWGLSLGPTVVIEGAMIKGGTSGGPVVDGEGSLVGVASWSNEDDGHGRIPLPHLSLPAWAWHAIEAAQTLQARGEGRDEEKALRRRRAEKRAGKAGA
jgi:hypothetical protein